MTYSINLEAATFEAFEAINEVDRNFINTENYLGVSYFWDYHYRHYMRPTTVAQRKRIHNKMFKAGLDVSEKSDAHARIIVDVLKGKVLDGSIHPVTEDDYKALIAD